MKSTQKPLLPLASKRFHLSKWYADCVSDSGDALVVYYGIARWRGITLHYSSLLTLIGNAPPLAVYSVSRGAAPSFDGEMLRWKSRSLHFEGTWKSIDPPHSETVFSSNHGAVEWNCLQPRARAEIQFGKNHVLSGLGYAERVEMSIAPWKIPIQELHWGRFLSCTDSLVWMDWRGSFSNRVLLHNGTTLAEGEVTEKQIRFGANGILTFGDGIILRRGTLGSAALAAIPGVKTFLPRQILGVQETKWRSRGQLTGVAEPSDGWSIHEVVTWPQ
jgi:hypothetical protein